MQDIMERPATETRYNGKACNATERQDITSIYEVVDVLGQGQFFFAIWGDNFLICFKSELNLSYSFVEMNYLPAGGQNQSGKKTKYPPKSTHKFVAQRALQSSPTLKIGWG